MNAQDIAQEALDTAETTDPGNVFVAGCREFFKKNGFLSDKQIAALRNVGPTRGSRFLVSSDERYDEAYGGELYDTTGDIFGVPNQ